MITINIEGLTVKDGNNIIRVYNITWNMVHYIIKYKIL